MISETFACGETNLNKPARNFGYGARKYRDYYKISFNWNSIERWLQAQIGRSYNEVLSDIRFNYKNWKDSGKPKNFWKYVECQLKQLEEDDFGWNEIIVKDGMICKCESRREKTSLPDYKAFEIVGNKLVPIKGDYWMKDNAVKVMNIISRRKDRKEGTSFIFLFCDNDIWYRITFTKTKINRLIWDNVLTRYVKGCQLVWKSDKKQLGKKEIKKFGLK